MAPLRVAEAASGTAAEPGNVDDSRV